MPWFTKVKKKTVCIHKSQQCMCESLPLENTNTSLIQPAHPLLLLQLHTISSGCHYSRMHL